VNVQALIIDRLGILAQGLSASDRFKAVQNIGDTGGQAELLWWVMVFSGVLAVFGVIAAIVYVVTRKRRNWKRFKKMGLRAGLRDQDMILLERTVRLVHLKNPTVIYADESVFSAATMTLMSSRRILKASHEVQQSLRAALSLIRGKLGFEVEDDVGDLSNLRSSRQVEEGSKVLVARMGEQESVEATVVRNSRTELLIAATETLPGRRDDDVLTIHYSNEQGVWEFDVRVIRCEGTAVAVEHSQEMRQVNFRRFPRVPTRMSATGTVIPFSVGSCEESLEFLAVEIVEIAGPGMLVKLPMKVDIGQNVLIRVELNEQQFIQGMTKVRRIIAGRPGGPFTAVEFTDLADQDLAELTRATNLAAGTSEHVLTAQVKTALV
jgi:hypothetical protein